MSVNEIAMLILFGSFFIMIICKMPVSIALATSSGLTMLYLGVPLMTMVQSMAKAVNNFSLMAIPFFILMGEIMGAGGISDRIVDFAKVLVGRFRGGLAQVNCLDSMLFGGISGSAVADVSSLGSIVIPMMKKSGYEEDFSVALTVTTSCQGVLIPPSHNMIIYAVAAGGVSVGRLFMGGLIPGIFLGVCLMIITAVISIRRNYPKEDPVPLKQALIITKDAFLALVTLLIIMVGVTAGFFTATESAAIACVYSFIISVFVYRKLKLRQMPELLLNTVKTLAMVFSLIAAAGAFGWVMAYLQVPKMITNATNKEVIWSSSDENVATVDNGVVTAVGNGTAAITVTTVDGNFTATCEVTVLIGDVNGDGAVDIGDLAIAAYYYNVTSEDENWPQAQVADIDNNGIVDIVDLAAIARNIQ
jgi:tripartite ATP-independent transporter DctM subunit